MAGSISKVSRPEYNPSNYLDSEGITSYTSSGNFRTRPTNGSVKWSDGRKTSVNLNGLSVNKTTIPPRLTNGDSRVSYTLTNGYKDRPQSNVKYGSKDSEQLELHISEDLRFSESVNPRIAETLRFTKQELDSTLVPTRSTLHSSDLSDYQLGESELVTLRGDPATSKIRTLDLKNTQPHAAYNSSRFQYNGHNGHDEPTSRWTSHYLPSQSVTSPTTSAIKQPLDRLTSVESDNSYRMSTSLVSSSLENDAQNSRPPSTSSAQSPRLHDHPEALSRNGAPDVPVDETLARKHFPVTLGAHLKSPPASISNGYLGHSLTPQIIIGKPTGKTNGHYKSQRSRSSHDRRKAKRPGSGQSSSSSNSRSSIGQLYLMSIESPPIQGGTTSMLSTTPYQAELERLRIDRLRLEEERLQQEKSQTEVEKAKVPVSKWYELKSPQFSSEFHKHNDRLRSAAGSNGSTTS